MIFSIGSTALEHARRHIGLRVKANPSSPMALTKKFNGGKLPAVVVDSIKVPGGYVGEPEREAVGVIYGLSLHTGETGHKISKDIAEDPLPGQSFYYTDTGQQIKGEDIVPNLGLQDGSRISFKQLFEGLIEKFYIEDTPRLFAQLINEFIERGGPPTGL